NVLVVRKVDADGAHRTGVARLHDRVHGARRHADHVGPPVSVLPRHAELKGGSCGSEPLQHLRALTVDAVDDALPGPFHAACIEVDLDEAVDGVDGGV